VVKNFETYVVVVDVAAVVVVVAVEVLVEMESVFEKALR